MPRRSILSATARENLMASMQRYRSSGLNLVTAAIVLWNAVYLERAAQALRGNGSLKDKYLLHYMSPLGWEHINLTGDYVGPQNRKVDEGQFRPLLTGENPWRPIFFRFPLFSPQREAMRGNDGKRWRFDKAGAACR